MIIDLFSVDKRISSECIAIEVSIVEFDGADLVIVVTSVIANSFLKIIAGRINCKFETVVVKIAEATLLIDGV